MSLGKSSRAGSSTVSLTVYRYMRSIDRGNAQFRLGCAIMTSVRLLLLLFNIGNVLAYELDYPFGRNSLMKIRLSLCVGSLFRAW